MSNDEMKKIAEVVREIVKEENKPILAKLESNSEKLEENTKRLDEFSGVLDKHGRVLDKHGKFLDENTKQIQANTGQFKSLSEQVAYLTERVDGEIIPTLETHTKYFKQIAKRLEKDKDNIERLDKRFQEPEARLGIQPPPELQIIK